MVFNSMQFLVFFPIVFMIYFLLPLKIRYVWLLVSSYYFYMCWNPKYALLLLFSTAITYLSGILIEFIKKRDWGAQKIVRSKKLCVAGSFIINLSILFFFKYFDFALANLNAIAGKVGIQFNHPPFDILLPVGISFYTFQALSYTMDVYRDETCAEKNFLKYALYVSFFPQLASGPIQRSKNLLPQINTPTRFDVQNARYGLFTMAYGLFLKIVVADRIALLINPMLDEYENYSGMALVICIMLYAIQIYCDFHGYTQIAIGCAKVLGFDLHENFNAPYLQGSIRGFWKSWHISLTSWFTDYLYIPLGGNRKGKLRKYLNTMIVFLCSGLWHGASWSFVVWGGLNGIYMVASDASKSFKQKLCTKLHIDTASTGWKILTRVITFLLVDYTWLYFRAGGLREAFRWQYAIYKNFHLLDLLSDTFYAKFGNQSALLFLFALFLIILLTDYCQYKGIDWKMKLISQQIFFRWFIYLSIIFVIIIGGIYGGGYEQTQFIYFQF